MKDSFSSHETVSFVGITYRQLDHWVRIGLITPSIREANGSGTGRRWSIDDLSRLTVAKRITDNGGNLRTVKRCLDALTTAGSAGEFLLVSPSSVDVATAVTLPGLIRAARVVQVVALEPFVPVSATLETVGAQ